VKLGIDRLS